MLERSARGCSYRRLDGGSDRGLTRGAPLVIGSRTRSTKGQPEIVLPQRNFPKTEAAYDSSLPLSGAIV